VEDLENTIKAAKALLLSEGILAGRIDSSTIELPTESKQFTKSRLRLLAIVVLLSTILPYVCFPIMPHFLFVVASNSMSPIINCGDVIVVSQSPVSNGSIIVFRNPVNSGFEVHRICWAQYIGNHSYYVTKGDALNQTDSFLIPQENVIGVASLTIPFIGFYYLIPRSPALFITMSFMALYMAIVYYDNTTLSREEEPEKKTSGNRNRKTKDEWVKKPNVKKIGSTALVLFLICVLPVQPSMMLAGVNLVYPKSQHLATVTTPEIEFQNGTEGSSTIGDGGNSATVSVSALVWLTGWQYRKNHVINPAGGAGTNFQIRIRANYGSGTDSGENVYLNGKCRTDFGDIRFTKSDGTSLLDYWMETKVDSNYAIFWVEIADDLSSSAVTIYIYYGKSDATSTSNGANTFIYFDDFSGGLGQWTIIAGTWSTSGGVLRATSGTGRLGLYITGSSLSNAAVDCKATAPVITADAHTLGPYYRGSGLLSGGDNFLRFYWHLTNKRWELKADSTFLGTNSSLSNEGVTRRISSRFYGNSLKMYVDDSLIISVTSTLGTSPGKVGVQTYSVTANNYLDDFRVRKYVDPGPSHGSWGSETSTSYHNVLKIVNKVADGWKINMKVYNSSNVGRLLSTTISLNDGTTSDQIIISAGVITQSEGALYDLVGSATIFISMNNLQATTSGTSNLYVYLKADIPSSGIHIVLQIMFQIN
jgi:signal peptidase I